MQTYALTVAHQKHRRTLKNWRSNKFSSPSLVPRHQARHMALFVNERAICSSNTSPNNEASTYPQADRERPSRIDYRCGCSLFWLYFADLQDVATNFGAEIIIVADVDNSARIARERGFHFFDAWEV